MFFDRTRQIKKYYNDEWVIILKGGNGVLHCNA